MWFKPEVTMVGPGQRLWLEDRNDPTIKNESSIK